ncbi:hypothetical protein [Paenibacillus sp. 2KB_22]|uniref:hypothetical protein n=1 Tax=Paenibacillus sp. 2KB_22 TaxID=3232978 RepID=UPI003F9A02B0
MGYRTTPARYMVRVVLSYWPKLLKKQGYGKRILSQGFNRHDWPGCIRIADSNHGYKLLAVYLVEEKA